MRRLRDRRPAGLFRGGELPRLMTMVVMLCVLGMMIRRARDQDTWRFLTGEPANLTHGAANPGPPHKPRVRSRQASHSADSIVVHAPESDAVLALPLQSKAPGGAAPHGTPADSSVSPSAEPARDRAEPKSDPAPVALALAPGPSSESAVALAPEAAAAPTNVPAANGDVAVDEPATQVVTPPDPKSAPAAPSPAVSSPAQSPSVASAKSDSEKNAAEGRAVGDGAAEDAVPNDAVPKDGATKAGASENSAPAADESSIKSKHAPLFRPHLPANPDTILQPGTVPVKPIIEPTPLDEDEEERRQFDHECEAISDRTPLGPEEMFAYWRLLRWSESQTVDEMLKRARTDVRYNDLLQRPEEFRGELLRAKLHIVQVLREDAPPDIPVGILHYYQGLGWNDASQSWFYFCIFADLPEGMTIGERVYEEGTFVGYFLKVHTYLDGKGTKTKAPILIGRMIYHPTPSIARNPNEWIWSYAIGGVLLVLFVARWGWRFFGRRKAAPEIKGLLRRTGLSEGEEAPLDIADWLDQVEASEPEKEIKPPDNHDSNGSAQGNGLPLRRDRGLDWTEDSER